MAVLAPAAVTQSLRWSLPRRNLGHGGARTRGGHSVMAVLAPATRSRSWRCSHPRRSLCHGGARSRVASEQYITSTRRELLPANQLSACCLVTGPRSTTTYI
ncbi:hypothetical protein chiPu_0010259 [Chiloscyllium punctatum]|uniref:Uncharacterized protein n=1 Tax=Chiloscyllium punctatum TaxID=137246 RepID=A0A401SN45_CHIPU|nr:hypothetical protein [Chiloscyllium punctatum]